MRKTFVVAFLLLVCLAAAAQTLVISVPRLFAGSNPAQVPITVRGTSGQTAPLFELQDSAGNVLLAASPTGRIRNPNFRRAMSLPSGSTTVITSVGTHNIGTGTLAEVEATDTESMMIEARTGATAGDDSGFGTGTVLRQVWRAGTNVVFQARVKFEETTDVRWWIGLTNQASTTMSNSDGPGGQWAAFRFSTAVPDTNYQCGTRGSGTFNFIDSGIVADTNGHDFQVVFNDDLATPNVEFYIDGSLVCTQTSDLPSSTTFGWVVYGETRAAATKNIRWAWTYVESDR